MVAHLRLINHWPRTPWHFPTPGRMTTSSHPLCAGGYLDPRQKPFESMFGIKNAHFFLSDPSSGHWHAQRDMVDPNSQLLGCHIRYLEIQFEYSRNLLSVRAEMGADSRGVKLSRGHM